MLSITATLAPMSAMHNAIARPMPPPPPVTSATCPVRSIALASISQLPLPGGLLFQQRRRIDQIVRLIDIPREALTVNFLEPQADPIGFGLVPCKAVSPEGE